MAADISFVPEDILREIFFTLEPKDISVVAQVCKLWNSIVTDSQFLESYRNDSFCRKWYDGKKCHSIVKDGNFNKLKSVTKLRFPLHSSIPFSKAIPSMGPWLQEISAFWWQEKSNHIFLGYNDGKIVRYDLNAPQEPPLQLQNNSPPLAALCTTTDDKLVTFSTDFQIAKWSLKENTDITIFPSSREIKSFGLPVSIYPFDENTVILSYRPPNKDRFPALLPSSDLICAYDLSQNKIVGGLEGSLFHHIPDRGMAVHNQKVFCSFGTADIFQFDIPSTELQQISKYKQDPQTHFKQMPSSSSKSFIHNPDPGICCLEVHKETLFAISYEGILFLINIADRTIQLRIQTEPCPIALHIINNFQLEVLCSTIDKFHITTVTLSPKKRKNEKKKQTQLVKVSKFVQTIKKQFLPKG